MPLQVILQENVEHLGKVGDVVKVKDGYARNFLLPNGLAAVASSRNVAQMEHQKRTAQARRDKIKTEAEKLAKAMDAEVAASRPINALFVRAVVASNRRRSLSRTQGAGDLMASPAKLVTARRGESL